MSWRHLDPSSGLWSVAIRNSLPRTKLENFSQAQVVASASFSIWAYRYRARSVGNWLLCACKRTAPKPFDEASVDIAVSFSWQ